MMLTVFLYRSSNETYAVNNKFEYEQDFVCLSDFVKQILQLCKL